MKGSVLNAEQSIRQTCRMTHNRFATNTPTTIRTVTSLLGAMRWRIAHHTFKKRGLVNCASKELTPMRGLKSLMADSVLRGSVIAMSDAVTHPSHYTAGSVEYIEAIEAALTPEQFKGYLRGNILKYLWRYPYKGKSEDLEKAHWYLHQLIEAEGGVRHAD